jgi:hypothetical protein
MKPMLFALAAAALLCHAAQGDFLEDFHGKALAVDPACKTGWCTLTGSGEATVSFTQKARHGFMTVDARADRRNIYWALIKRAVTKDIDMAALARPGHALRVEMKLRLSDAPRRVHFQINTNRTTDFHANLREFDIADTAWHTIAWTNTGLDVKPGDDVFVTLGMTDMGRAVYTSEIEYVKASVVDKPEDLGTPLTYRPVLAAHFANTLTVAEDAILDSAYPWVNLKDWTELNPDEGTLGVHVDAVSGSQITILKFDLAKFKGRTADGWGTLELTTTTAGWAPTNLEEFGFLRAVEIKATAPDFTRATVTWDSFFAGRPVLDVLNGQLFFDVQPAVQRAGKTVIAINPAVMQRLIDGTSKGIAVYGQGALNFSFASSQAPGEGSRPTLRFNVK